MNLSCIISVVDPNRLCSDLDPDSGSHVRSVPDPAPEPNRNRKNSDPDPTEMYKMFKKSKFLLCENVRFGNVLS